MVVSGHCIDARLWPGGQQGTRRDVDMGCGLCGIRCNHHYSEPHGAGFRGRGMDLAYLCGTGIGHCRNPARARSRFAGPARVRPAAGNRSTCAGGLPSRDPPHPYASGNLGFVGRHNDSGRTAGRTVPTETLARVGLLYPAIEGRLERVRVVIGNHSLHCSCESDMGCRARSAVRRIELSPGRTQSMAGTIRDFRAPVPAGLFGSAGRNDSFDLSGRRRSGNGESMDIPDLHVLRFGCFCTRKGFVQRPRGPVGCNAVLDDATRGLGIRHGIRRYRRCAIRRRVVSCPGPLVRKRLGRVVIHCRFARWIGSGFEAERSFCFRRDCTNRVLSCCSRSAAVRTFPAPNHPLFSGRIRSVCTAGIRSDLCMDRKSD